LEKLATGFGSLEDEAAQEMEKTARSALKNVSEPCQRHMTLYLQTVFSGNLTKSPFFESKS